jgi:2-polyprenyl-3-methyl-5-hydroxy-6-metoxy-1,4-benzoquinol methylase
MNTIENYFFDNFNLKNLNLNSSENAKRYCQDAQADAIHCYQSIEKYLDKDKKVLEVGGGIHLLTSFLHKDYDITSIEPGSFTSFTDELRNKILDQYKLKVYTTTVEKFTTDAKFDFIFSMNVLEHTDDIKRHITSCMNLLKDEHSLLFIQCPNYTFPFEPHFYKWFIPFFPNFTFATLRRKRLMKELGKDKYENILNNLNFDCTYRNLQKLSLPIKFTHPLQDIFDRLDKDATFRQRLCSNFVVKICYQLISLLKIKKLLISVYPKFLSPYLIMKIKKNFDSTK